jgi:hypothetical protein
VVVEEQEEEFVEVDPEAVVVEVLLVAPLPLVALVVEVEDHHAAVVGHHAVDEVDLVEAVEAVEDVEVHRASPAAMSAH